ncbi:MAG: hypothetical protein ACRDY0_10890 [Acidimicrobiales bacterium]
MPMPSPDPVVQPSPGSSPGSGYFADDDQPIAGGASLFVDDRWDLTPICHRQSLAARTLNFATVPNGWRLAAKEVSATLLNPVHPAVLRRHVVRRARPAKAGTVLLQLGYVRSLARWAAGHGVPAPSAWAPRHTAELLAEAPQLGPALLTGRLQALRLLWELNPVISGGGLKEDPLNGHGPSSLAGRPSLECRTSPLAFETWSAALRAAWKLVELCSGELLAARRTWKTLPARGRPGSTSTLERVDTSLAAGYRVPLHTGVGHWRSVRGQLNKELLCRQLDLPSHHHWARRSSNKSLIALIDECANNPIRSLLGGVWEPTVTFPGPDGEPRLWVEELGIGEIDHLTSVLRGACYVVLAALTGMRDSEIQSLRRGATGTVMVDGHGEVVTIRGVQFKGERSAHGRERSWYAIDPVARAIEVLTSLAVHDQLLFAPLSSGGEPGGHGPTGGRPSAYVPSRDIGRFVAWVNADRETRIGRGWGVGESIDPGDGPINQRVLRRSFAVYAATYPEAEIGLGIQLGHAALRMTSGYYSDSTRQTAAMIEDERVKVVSDNLRDVLQPDAPLDGPGAERLRAFRAEVNADPAILPRRLRGLASSYHLGTLNDCFYDSDTARCGTDGPHLTEAACRSTACPNAVETTHHLPGWERLLADQEELAETVSHPALLGRLEADIKETRAQVVRLRRRKDSE